MLFDYLLLIFLRILFVKYRFSLSPSQIFKKEFRSTCPLVVLPLEMPLFDYRRSLIQSELVIVRFVTCFLVLIHYAHLHFLWFQQQLHHPYFIIALLDFSECIEQRCLSCFSLLVYFQIRLISEQVLHKSVVIASYCIMETVLPWGVSEIQWKRWNFGFEEIKSLEITRFAKLVRKVEIMLLI